MSSMPMSVIGAYGSYGARSGAKTATNRVSPNMISPVRPTGWWSRVRSAPRGAAMTVGRVATSATAVIGQASVIRGSSQP